MFLDSSLHDPGRQQGIAEIFDSPPPTWKDLGWILVSWLLPVPTLVLAGIWEVNQCVDNLPACVPVTLSSNTVEINKN